MTAMATPDGEKAAFAVFVLAVLLVLVAYAGEIVRLLLRRPLPPPSPWRRRWRATVLVVGTLGIGCIVYGFTVEPTWVEVTRTQVPLARWPAGAPSVRLVHVSDLHVEGYDRNERDLPALVAAEKPDLIVFTGDALNVEAGLPRLVACFGALSRIAPLYAVKGNWDVRQMAHVPALENTRARILEGEAVDLELRGVRLTLAGVGYGEDEALARLLARLPKDRPTILLHHTPDPILEVADAGLDLQLSGHTHGGQVRLPLYGSLLTFSRHGKRFDGGLYRVRDTFLYVNRGLGMEGGLAPRVRFLCRPELTVLDLVAPR
jgi:hypothetical protein